MITECVPNEAKQKRKIYLASSWRNPHQQAVLKALRDCGHEVYDFKNPADGVTGFSWSAVDPEWKNWNTSRYRELLQHPIAQRGFDYDFDAMEWADTFVLVLPCGRSAHLELGWAVGQRKKTVVLLDTMEPELMVKMCDHLCVSLQEVIDILHQDRDFIMVPGHPRWRDFTARLASPSACDFQDGSSTWSCKHGSDRSFARAILKDMGADVEGSLAYFSEHGGHCDCEILFNVDQ